MEGVKLVFPIPKLPVRNPPVEVVCSLVLPSKANSTLSLAKALIDPSLFTGCIYILPAELSWIYRSPVALRNTELFPSCSKNKSY